MRDSQGDMIDCFICVVTHEACSTVLTFLELPSQISLVIIHSLILEPHSKILRFQ